MTVKISVKQAQKHIADLTHDRDVRLSELRKRAEEARNPVYAGQLRDQADALEKTYQPILERANQVLETARVDEAKENQILEQRRQAREAALKERARTTWIRAGGDPSQFETAWPTLQASILAEKVTQEMTAESTEKPMTL